MPKMHLVKSIAIKRNKVQLNRPIVYIYLPGAHSAGKFNLCTLFVCM